MDALHLTAIIAGTRVALPAALVGSVVEIEAVTPVPRVAPHIAGLAALRSRVVTIVDAEAALGLPPAARATPFEAIVIAVDGHSYGIAVDRVDDVVSFADPPLPLGGPLAAGWSRIATGLLADEAGLVLLVDPGAIVAGCGSSAEAA